MTKQDEQSKQAPHDHPTNESTKWNQGFQSGFEAGRISSSETRKALANLKHDHHTFVNNTSVALIQNDERIHQLEKKLENIYQECADICERRAESLPHGSDVARLCKRDILSRANAL
jgi:hypothetical protein